MAGEDPPEIARSDTTGASVLQSMQRTLVGSSSVALVCGYSSLRLPPISMTIHFTDQGATRVFADPAGMKLDVSQLKVFDDDYISQGVMDAFVDIHSHPDGIGDEEQITRLVRAALKKAGRLSARPLQWYWVELFDTMRRLAIREESSEFLIGIKGCWEHSFYTLSLDHDDRRDKRWEWLHTPFFQCSTPGGLPTERAAQERAIGDLLVFLAPRFERFRNATNYGIENEESSTEDIRAHLRRQLRHEIGWFDIRWHCAKPAISGSDMNIYVTPEVRSPSPVVETPSGQVLVTSPNVRKAINDLAEVWLNPGARSVLISAWTGSGKEILVGLLSDALRISDRCVDLAAPELKDMPGLVRQFTRKMTKLGLREQPVDSKTEPPEDRGVLFLDEIHHDSAKDLRSGLLRVMEKDQLTIDPEHFVDCRSLLYVFAASERPPQLRADHEPPDLWNRIEYTVEVQHPLLLDKGEERKGVLSDYFDFFWERRSAGWADSEPSRAIHAKVDRFLRGNPGTDPSDKSWTLARDVKRDLAVLFCDQFSSPLIPLVSIRTLRTIVKRLFGRTVTFLRTFESAAVSRGDVDATIRSRLKAEFEEWILALANELLTEIDSKGSF